jgi:hypothetical protein
LDEDIGFQTSANTTVDFESRLISVVNNLVEKAEESIDPDLLPNKESAGSETTVDIASSLSRRIARLWACLYHKQNSPWIGGYDRPEPG